jgi:predicted deacetylase
MLKVLIGLSLIFVITGVSVYEFSGVFDLPVQIPSVNNCNVVVNPAGERNIILRIDDIQAYAYKEIQTKMIQELINQDLTATLAIIPKGISQDQETYEFLIENKCKFDMALHGYDHSEDEFRYLGYDVANEKIINGLIEIKWINSRVTTFVPPNNDMSEESKHAAQNNGIKIISQDFWSSDKHGMSVSTYDWERKILRNVTDVLQKCEQDLENFSRCIIMIHPQDYLTNNEWDEEKFGEYLELLKQIQEMNATIINLRDLYFSEAEYTAEEIYSKSSKEKIEEQQEIMKYFPESELVSLKN